MWFKYKISSAGMDDFGNFREMPVGDRRTIKAVRLPAPQALLDEVIVVRRQKAARSKRDDLPMDLVRFGDTVTACLSNKIADLWLRQLVESITCGLQQVASLSLGAHQIRICA